MRAPASFPYPASSPPRTVCLVLLAPLLSLAEVAYYRDVRTGGQHVADDPTLSPLRDRDFSELPRTAIITAACDPVSSEGELYRDRILAAGGQASWIEIAALSHSFLRARKTVARAAAGFDLVVAAVAGIERGDARR